MLPACIRLQPSHYLHTCIAPVGTPRSTASCVPTSVRVRVRVRVSVRVTMRMGEGVD